MISLTLLCYFGICNWFYSKIMWPHVCMITCFTNLIFLKSYIIFLLFLYKNPNFERVKLKNRHTNNFYKKFYSVLCKNSDDFYNYLLNTNSTKFKWMTMSSLIILISSVRSFILQPSKYVNYDYLNASTMLSSHLSSKSKIFLFKLFNMRQNQNKINVLSQEINLNS